MPRKSSKKSNSDYERPDYENLKTFEAIEEEITKHKNYLVGKDRLESNLKQEKKDFMSSINEQLKEVHEEREHEIGVLSALDDCKRVLHAQSNVVPLSIPIPKSVRGS